MKKKNEFSFVFFGDTRGTGGKNQISPELKDIISQINGLKSTPAFVLHGGDIANTGTIKNFDDFLDIISPVSKKIPFFVIPGNHEVYQPNKTKNQFNLANFHEKFGPDKYVIRVPASFDFQVLAENNVTDLPPIPRKNNKNIKDVHYGFNDQNITAMEAIVRKNSGRSVIAFHAPPGINKCWGTHGMGPSQTEKFLSEVVDKHPHKIQLILTSHIHGFSVDKRGNTSYVLSGGGGAPFETKCVYQVINFVVFTVTSTTITYKVHWRFRNEKTWRVTKSIKVQ